MRDNYDVTEYENDGDCHEHCDDECHEEGDGGEGHECCNPDALLNEDPFDGLMTERAFRLFMHEQSRREEGGGYCCGQNQELVQDFFVDLLRLVLERLQQCMRTPEEALRFLKQRRFISRVVVKSKVAELGRMFGEDAPSRSEVGEIAEDFLDAAEMLSVPHVAALYVETASPKG